MEFYRYLSLRFEARFSSLRAKRSNLIIAMILFCAGCSTVSPKEKNIYEQGYRAGVQEQMHDIAGQFQGGNFPYYHWTQPMVQEVSIPGHLTNGVFIPEHKELVIIKPGEWALSPAYPIKTQDKEINHAIHDHDVSDITHLPQCVGQSACAVAGSKGENSKRPMGASN